MLDVLDADERFDTVHDLLVDDAPPHFEAFLTNPSWNLTLLAPTDDAFAALPDGVLDALRRDSDTLTLVLDQHILLDYLPAQDVIEGEVEAVVGSVEASVDDGTIRFDDATVVEADIEASNGIIHAVDTVLVPDSVDLDTLTE